MIDKQSASGGDEIWGILTGSIAFSWFHVERLVVDPGKRGKGIGSALLTAAEEIAVQQKLAGVYLDTMSFQAPEFYIKHGYRVVGRIDGIPPGHARIYLSKPFDT